MDRQADIIVIKDDDEEESEDCNHRIVSLRCQRSCQSKARLCRQKCPACQKHGTLSLKNDHRDVSVEEFTRAFTALEQTCSKQTQHYIRQMNETERKAIQVIRRKKEECFTEIEKVKVNLMKKTYAALQDKYPDLYIKFKSNRLDTLRCSEVYWVLNTPPDRHPIKHSEINKILEGILKTFENFKEVSRNIKAESMFTNKEKVKKGKIAEKIGGLLAKSAPNKEDKLERRQVNYYHEEEEKLKKEIDKLSRQLVGFKERKNNAEIQLRALVHQIQLYSKIKKQKIPQLALKAQVYNIKNDPEESVQDKKSIRGSDNLEKEGSGSFQKQDRIIQESIVNFPNIQEEKENHAAINNQMVDEEPPSQEPQHEREVSEIQDGEVQGEANQAIQQERDQDMRSEEEERDNSREEERDISREEERDISREEESPAEEGLEEKRSSIKEAAEEQKYPQMQQRVKIEANPVPFQPWKNSELLCEMRTFGKTKQSALKIEEIDALSSLPFITPPKNLLKATPPKPSEPSGPTRFNLIANKLFSKINENKKGEDKDKPQ